MSLSPEQRSLRASIAANSRWAQEDPVPAMATVRQGWQRRLEDEVDPGRQLSETERARRVQAALRAHMLRLALASSRARAARKRAS